MITAKEAREMQSELIWSEIENSQMDKIQLEMAQMLRSNCSSMAISQETSPLVIEKLQELGYVYKHQRIGWDSDGNSLYHCTISW